MNETNNSPINTITEGTTIKGDIIANGDFRMDGILDGNLTLNGKLVVGEKGLIRGNIQCQIANIIGRVEGNLEVKDHLTLYVQSSVKGDIATNKLSIEPGALFTGSCKMQDNVAKK